MSGSSLEGKLFKKPQNPELYGFLLQVDLQHKIQVLQLNSIFPKA